MRCVTRCFSCFDSVDDLDDYRDPRLSDGGQPRGPIQICTPTVASLAQLQPVQEMRQPRERDRAHRPRFDRIPDSPWLVQRSVEYGGKLFWTHEHTRETTWRQPLPRTCSLPADVQVHPGLRAQAVVADKAAFFGAPKDPNNPSARTGICGVPPGEAQLRRTCEAISLEHSFYPAIFLERIGLKRVLLCEELHYNGQRRRDVPDLGSGTLYIDVGDRPLRRKRHSFHHELWHMVDYHLLGNQFEAYDEDWCAYNPQGFSYGRGGKHMRSDSKSSQLASAPSTEFLNRYSTSSVAEDKAEIWATLMCYQHVLVAQGGASQVLSAKAELLQRRARQICEHLDEVWWVRVREEQLKQTDHWEAHSSEEPGKGQYWFNWVTGERRSSKPEGHH
uniref:WW domain-containing protein n=1 Tax=Phaeocystis antarctica TaxID=33657 RepID=A0A7S0EVA2_9EUKA